MRIREGSLSERLLFSPKEKIQRSSQIWHTVFSVLIAVQSTLLLFLVTRFSGSEKAGVVSLAFSVAYLMIAIGNYGVRNYQATDVNIRFGFREYLTHRIATCAIMALASIGYVFLRGYESEKAGIVLSLCLLKLIESVENVYHAEYQRANRLDVASKTGSFRVIASMIVFMAVLLLTGNVLAACLVMDLASAVLLAVFLLMTYPRIQTGKAKEKTDWKVLFSSCLPLFLSSFFYIYICNASKYALDVYASESDQGFFGMIFMPVFAINLVSSCIYGPFLVRLAVYWKNNQIRPLKRFVLFQTSGVLIISAVVAAAGYLIGTQLLSFLYGYDLTEYRIPLAILLAGSGMTALVDFSNNMLTVIRKQKILPLIYGIFAAVSFFVSRFTAQQSGIMGVSCSYSAVMLCQATVMILYLAGCLRKGNPDGIG